LSKDGNDDFYERAHEHLRVASEQLPGAQRGEVSASMMYACARFNVWLSASRHASASELKDAYGETIQYFIAEYRKMLVKNLDDFVENFGEYMRRDKDDAA
jgi:Protein of unknown function (DUF3144)